MEGSWNFTLSYPYEDNELPTTVEVYNATIDGNTITFIDQYGDGLIGEFVAENTVVFNKCKTPDGFYTQIPFVNTNGTTDVYQLVQQPITATYQPLESTLVFPANSGFINAYCNESGEMVFFNYAFNVDSASQGEAVYGDPAIEGNWIFTLDGTYVGESNLNVFTENYVATLEGNIVTFTSTVSDFNIVAEFTGKNVLTFSSAAVAGLESQYPLWQTPYTNGETATSLDELNNETFLASFLNGSIYFPEGAGLKYRYVNAETGVPEESWLDAFGLISATKSIEEEEPNPTPDEGDITGVMTADDSDRNGNTFTWNVTASYSDNVLTIYNFAGMSPLKLYVDPTTGGVASSYMEVAEVTNGLTFYYADPQNDSFFIYGAIYNDGDKCVVELDPWGIAFEDDGDLYFNGAYYYTVVTLDTTISGLPSDKPSGIDSIGNDNTKVEYYDLTGRKVNNPKGGIFIRVEGKKASKVLVK